jgi:ABC-type molybdate transport system substrate-binding protein
MKVRYKTSQSLVETINELSVAKVYLHIKKRKVLYKVEAGIEYNGKKIEMLNDKIIIIHPSSTETDLEIADKRIKQLIIENILLFTPFEDTKIPGMGSILYYPQKYFDKFYDYYTQQ